MSVYIRFKRGAEANIPEEAMLGEPLFATDTLNLFIGMGPGKPVKKIGIIDPDDYNLIHEYYVKVIEKWYGKSFK